MLSVVLEVFKVDNKDTGTTSIDVVVVSLLLALRTLSTVINTLTHFKLMSHFYFPWKMMFSGGRYRNGKLAYMG